MFQNEHDQIHDEYDDETELGIDICIVFKHFQRKRQRVLFLAITDISLSLKERDDSLPY